MGQLVIKQNRGHMEENKVKISFDFGNEHLFGIYCDIDDLYNNGIRNNLESFRDAVISEYKLHADPAAFSKSELARIEAIISNGGTQEEISKNIKKDKMDRMKEALKKKSPLGGVK